ncbi:unnamed protein product [Triticum turgidum subsp. durum]|uniref:Uncharacterized protein n=1 Tax=Triticum turgidum subsp. durum TaxID=4567 RepID=A0A9R1PZR8_TRITD|nr:unnamed protein product [Triticum turgidum subsp. durum]
MTRHCAMYFLHSLVAISVHTEKNKPSISYLIKISWIQCHFVLHHHCIYPTEKRYGHSMCIRRLRGMPRLHGATVSGRRRSGATSAW